MLRSHFQRKNNFPAQGVFLLLQNTTTEVHQLPSPAIITLVMVLRIPVYTTGCWRNIRTTGEPSFALTLYLLWYVVHSEEFHLIFINCIYFQPAPAPATYSQGYNYDQNQTYPQNTVPPATTPTTGTYGQGYPPPAAGLWFVYISD